MFMTDSVFEMNQKMTIDNVVRMTTAKDLSWPIAN